MSEKKQPPTGGGNKPSTYQDSATKKSIIPKKPKDK